MSRIFLSKADVTPVEERYVVDALRSGWVAPLGPDVDAFEAEMAARTGVSAAVALSSGTAALHLALLEVGAKPGTVVVLPSMTFAASANAVTYTGADAVFVDSRTDDGNVDPDLLVEAVDTIPAEGTDVAAVMTVDLFGRCADYAAIVPALADRGVPLIEDAAEALGASTDATAAGAFGRAAALSFNGNKIMTTSGGGMLLSNDAELISRARYLSTQARQPVPWYEHTEVGFNYRMSNLLAALGRGQLSRLDDMIQKRRAIRMRYAQAIADIPDVRLLGSPDGLDEHQQENCWLSCIVLGEEHPSPDQLITSMDKQDIETRHLWKPMHLQPLYEKSRVFANGTSEALFSRGVTLPSGSALTEGDIERVVSALRSSLGMA
jgi:dTDP-4-amino-4,6-dideoxygalactose transaminase